MAQGGRGPEHARMCSGSSCTAAKATKYPPWRCPAVFITNCKNCRGRGGAGCALARRPGAASRSPWPSPPPPLPTATAMPAVDPPGARRDSPFGPTSPAVVRAAPPPPPLPPGRQYTGRRAAGRDSFLYVRPACGSVDTVKCGQSMGPIGSGMSNAWKMQGLDGKFYIVKFHAGGDRTAPSELLCAYLSRRFGLPSLEPVLMQLDRGQAEQISRARTRRAPAGRPWQALWRKVFRLPAHRQVVLDQDGQGRDRKRHS